MWFVLFACLFVCLQHSIDFPAFHLTQGASVRHVFQMNQKTKCTNLIAQLDLLGIGLSYTSTHPLSCYHTSEQYIKGKCTPCQYEPGEVLMRIDGGVGLGVSRAVSLTRSPAPPYIKKSHIRSKLESSDKSFSFAYGLLPWSRPVSVEDNIKLPLCQPGIMRLQATGKGGRY